MLSAGPGRDGLVVVVTMSAGGTIWVDSPLLDGRIDVTEAAAALSLLGWQIEHERFTGQQLEPVEAVDGAQLTITGTLQGWQLDLEAHTADTLDAHRIEELLAAGVADTLTSAVASALTDCRLHDPFA